MKFGDENLQKSAILRAVTGEVDGSFRRRCANNAATLFNGHTHQEPSDFWGAFVSMKFGGENLQKSAILRAVTGEVDGSFRRRCANNACAEYNTTCGEDSSAGRLQNEG